MVLLIDEDVARKKNAAIWRKYETQALFENGFAEQEN